MMNTDNDFFNNKPQVAQQPANNNVVDSLMQNTAHSVETIKRKLYDKIDVCCAQYGLYGLQIIDKAIANSIANMMNTFMRPQTETVYQPPQPYPYQQTTQDGQPMTQLNEQTEQIQLPVQQPAQQMPIGGIGSTSFTDSFVNHLGEIMAKCDEYDEQLTEKRLKEQLAIQKQIDSRTAQQELQHKVYDNLYKETAQQETTFNDNSDFFTLSEEVKGSNVKE